MQREIIVKGNSISLKQIPKEYYISLNDIAKYKNKERTDYLISNWLRNRGTIEFLGLWEKINNSNFKSIEFDGIRLQSGLNTFILTPSKWIKKTNAKGIISQQGRYGGTFAHKDIALEFATWISVEFKLHLIKEFQRLKEHENKSISWNVKRELSKINYKIHTDAIKENLIPKEITKSQTNKIYADEADVLNIALFGKTAKEWNKNNQNKKGNIRDYTNITQLIVLSNLEVLNSEFINQNLSQKDRLIKLNQIAISQMNLLTNNKNIKKLENK